MHVRFCMWLIEAVGVLEIFGWSSASQALVEHVNDLIKRERVAGTAIEDITAWCLECANGQVDHIFDVDKITSVLASTKYSWGFTVANLAIELIDHAGGTLLVRFSRTIHVEVTQADDPPRRIVASVIPGEVFELDFGKSIHVGGKQRLFFTLHTTRDSIGCRRSGVYHRDSIGSCEFQHPAKSFDIIVALEQLIVLGGVGDGCFVENGVEGVPPKARFPIRSGYVPRDEIPLESSQVLEVSRSKIIEDDNP